MSKVANQLGNGVSKCNLYEIMAIKSIVILDLIDICRLPNETIKILIQPTLRAINLIVSVNKDKSKLQ